MSVKTINGKEAVLGAPEKKINVPVIEAAKQAPAVDAAAHVEELTKKGAIALEKFLLLDQKQVDTIVAKASVAAVDQHGKLALHAIEETGRGIFEDKATKNMFAAEKSNWYLNIWNALIKMAKTMTKHVTKSIMHLLLPVWLSPMHS